MKSCNSQSPLNELIESYILNEQSRSLSSSFGNTASDNGNGATDTDANNNNTDNNINTADC